MISLAPSTDPATGKSTGGATFARPESWRGQTSGSTDSLGFKSTATRLNPLAQRKDRSPAPWHALGPQWSTGTDVPGSQGAVASSAQFGQKMAAQAEDRGVNTQRDTVYNTTSNHYVSTVDQRPGDSTGAPSSTAAPNSGKPAHAYSDAAELAS